MNNENLNFLYEFRHEYIKNQYDQCSQFDKAMFVISSGVFGITFTFITDVVEAPIQDTLWLLIVSWGLILSTIILSLTAYLITYYAYKKEISFLDRRIKSFPALEKKIIKSNCTSSEALNILNLITLSCGLVFLILYVGINMKGV